MDPMVGATMYVLDGQPRLFVAVFGGIALVIVTIAAVVAWDMWATFRGKR
jgi:hypothetical protein